MTDSTKAIPTPVLNRFNTEGEKIYIFNQTGNIMMSFTDSDEKDISESVKETFAKVSVFFDAMTKAISQTENPRGRKIDGKLPKYSIYNYEAIEKLITCSGYFIHISQQDMHYKNTKSGVDINKDLIMSVLNIASINGALGFANAMITSIAKEGLNLSEQSNINNSKVANTIFICESVRGMPLVSVIVISADSTHVSDVYRAAPCFKSSNTKIELTLRKDTYMFVSPELIKDPVNALNTEINNPDYLKLIDYLQSLIEKDLK